MTEKNPAYQWYPGDWRRDPGVQALDYEHRGVWRELIDMMHWSPERGRLLFASGNIPNDEEVAQMLGIAEAKWKQIRSKLLSTGVAKLDADGAIVCRRMWRDEQTLRARREAGRKGGTISRPKQNESNGEATAKQTDPPPISYLLSPSPKKREKPSVSRPEDGTRTHIDDAALTEFRDLFVRLCPDLPKPREPGKWTPDRRAQARRALQTPPEPGWEAVFRAVHAADDLCGRGVRARAGWKVGFFWLLKPSNLSKLLDEGMWGFSLDSVQASHPVAPKPTRDQLTRGYPKATQDEITAALEAFERGDTDKQREFHQTWTAREEATA